jgi:hypothetical protein
VTPAEMLAAFSPTPLAAAATEGPLLVGYHLDAASVRQNERFELGLFWSAPAAATVAVIVSLGDRVMVSETLTLGAATATRLTLRVPADQPPGPVPLRVTLDQAEALTLTALEIAGVARAWALPASAVLAGPDFAGKVRLAGYEVAAGAPTRVTLYWQALTDGLPDDYTVFLHLRDSDGQIVAQADAQPRVDDTRYPTSMWRRGEVVTDEHQFTLVPGNYSVWVGLYLTETGERLPVLGVDMADQVLLTSLSVP